MTNEELKKLLGGLAARTSEQVRPGLAEQIKHQIPRRLPWHKGRMDTINIIIDLRINRFAAAAVIILALILFANLLGGRDSGGLYSDSKLVAEYLFGGSKLPETGVAAGMSKYKSLAAQGRDVVFYGEFIDPEDDEAVLMQWKLGDGNYRVMFGDLHQKTVTAEQLIHLQSRMLLKKEK